MKNRFLKPMKDIQRICPEIDLSIFINEIEAILAHINKLSESIETFSFPKNTIDTPIVALQSINSKFSEISDAIVQIKNIELAAINIIRLEISHKIAPSIMLINRIKETLEKIRSHRNRRKL